MKIHEELDRYRIGVIGGDVDFEGGSVHGDLRLEKLTNAGLEWEAIDETEPDPRLAAFDALYLMGGRRVDADLLRHAPRIRHIARFGAGYDSVDVSACTAPGVVLPPPPGAFRRPLALAGLTMVLAVTHNLVQKHRLAEHGDWHARRYWRGHHTDGSTIAVVGFGSVGAELAQMLTGLGFQVLGVNRRGAHPVATELDIPMVNLDEALSADVVVLTAALTPQTQGMIADTQLGLMRPDASLVNIGRGGLVDHAALARALHTGRLRAAGLDVFDPEPLPADDPLLSLPNVTLSPHSLCWTQTFTDGVVEAANTSLKTAARGESPPGAVNPEACRHTRWSR